MSTVGSRIKKEMLRLGYDSSEISKIAGVTERAQYNYENDIRKPKTEYWEAIAKVGTNVQYIITGVESSVSVEKATDEIKMCELEDTLEMIYKQVGDALVVVKRMRGLR